MSDEYYIGLDIGTSSVGWAVTDGSYRLRKYRGETLWGVRLFDEAQTAEARRTFRVARRRLEKRRQRLAFLQEVFSEAIGRIDPDFFGRLRESRFAAADKQADREGTELGPDILFAGQGLNDSIYARRYPTIYHLRKALLDNVPEAFEPRLVYLALHHIFKYRGHFLFGDMKLEHIDFDTCLSRLNDSLRDSGREPLAIDAGRKQAFISILCAREAVGKKKDQLAQCLELSRKDGNYYAVALLSGSSEKLFRVCGDQYRDCEPANICLRDDLEESRAVLEAVLGDDMDLIVRLKALYDWSVLQEICGGEPYLSYAMVSSYERHRSDLHRLKAVLNAGPANRAHRKAIMEGGEKDCSYRSYTGHAGGNAVRRNRARLRNVSEDGKLKDMETAGKKCDRDAFLNFLEKQVQALPDKTADTDLILQEIKDRTFLPLQRTKDNAVIPHQVHLQELSMILQNAVSYPQLAFLGLEYRGHGTTAAQALQKMFCFRVPYFVGPLNERSSHAWVVRGGDKIYPWNFERVVDLRASAERFIRRMTASCTYLSGCKVLPGSSLLYSRFMVLNEINNLRISGLGISVEVKQELYEQLFMKHRRVTGRMLRDYLLARGHIGEDDEITGIDGNAKASLTSYLDLQWLLGKKDGMQLAEDVISAKTVLGNNGPMLRDYLREHHGAALSEEEIKRLITEHDYSGWGRLSREFLEEVRAEVDGHSMSIIEALWHTNDNLMQLLSQRYGFAKSLESLNASRYNAQSLNVREFLEDAYISPAVRRAIMQAHKIVAEIVQLMKRPPERIFLEMTRGGDKVRKRTQTRKDRLDALYSRCREDYPQIRAELERCGDGELRRDVLYLYFLQQGRCMYSGDPINIAELGTGRYNIDHIYPQWAVKDDSLDNRVLVRTEFNQDKGRQVISPEVRGRMRGFWRQLRDRGFISEEKFRRLTRTADFAADELSGFISRQLVETSQAAKVTARLFDLLYGDTTRVVYVRARNVADFRHDQRRKVSELGLDDLYPPNERGSNQMVQDPLFVKCRPLNNLHHAKDAYLNIVVGNVYNARFTDNPMVWLRGSAPHGAERTPYNISRVFDYDVLRGSDVVWRAGVQGSIVTVRDMMRRNSILVTRMSIARQGKMFEEQQGRGKGTVRIGQDERLSIARFGGYRRALIAYFAVVEYAHKKKITREVVSVLIRDRERYERDPQAYCADLKHCDRAQVRIVVSKIPVYTRFIYKGFAIDLSGSAGNNLLGYSAMELKLDPIWQLYINNLEKFKERQAHGGMGDYEPRYDHVSVERNLELYRLLIGKIESTALKVKFSNALNKMQSGETCFTALDMLQQTRVLLDIIGLLKCDGTMANLKAIGGADHTLIASTPKGGFAREAVLITQSVTGLHRTCTDLAKA